MAERITQKQRDAMEELAKMASEPLCDELKQYLCEGPFGECVKHPLVVDIIVSLPGELNRRLAYKKQELAKAEDEKRWHDVVFIHERPFRCEALIDYVVGRGEDMMPFPLADLSQEARDLAADVWVDSENIHQHIEDWTAMYEWEPGMPMLFNDDPEQWERLPDPLTVYRATIDDGDWSWTLDPKVAVFFGKRFKDDGATTELIQGKVAKGNVFGFLTRRSESEVLVRNGTVRNVVPYVP